MFCDQDIAVAGGGDSAQEEAIFLTRFANSVTPLQRRGELRASKIMQDRAHENPKINFRWNTQIAEAHGDEKPTGLSLRDTVTGEPGTVDATGLFVVIGHDPLAVEPRTESTPGGGIELVRVRLRVCHRRNGAQHVGGVRIGGR